MTHQQLNNSTGCKVVLINTGLSDLLYLTLVVHSHEIEK